MVVYGDGHFALNHHVSRKECRVQFVAVADQELKPRETFKGPVNGAERLTYSLGGKVLAV